MNKIQQILLVLFLALSGTQIAHAQDCVDCNVMVCDGVNCDDGSSADGVQTSRKCGCGTEISGACAKVVVDLTLNPYFDPNDPNCGLIFKTQEQGNFSIYMAEGNCEVSNCGAPDFVVSSGQTISGFPSSGVFTLMVCKNGGNAGRRDFSFSISCSTVENCVNQVDDNGNNFIDCDDADCSLDENCTFSSTSSGNDGGLESNKRLAQKIARRNYLRSKSNTTEVEIRTEENLFENEWIKAPVLKSGNSENINLIDFIPENAIPGAETYTSSPTDLINITNAREVYSVDIFKAEKRVASVFTTLSENGVYEHTKFICDRLHGAEIEQIWEHHIDGQHPFIVTKFTRASGITEYACNFSFFKTEAGDIQMESHWNTAAYTPEKEYVNFQIWANNMLNLESIVKEALMLIHEKGLNIYYNFSAAPNLFVSKVSYEKGLLNLDVVNKNRATQLDLKGEWTATETEEAQALYQVLPLEGHERERVSLQTEGIYNMGLSLYHKTQTVADGVYVADGAWGLDYPVGGAMIYDYEILPNDFSSDQEGYLIERNLLLRGTLRDHVAAYRALNPAFRPVDLSAYNTLSFEARGTGDLEITIVRSGIQDWEKQMKTAVKITEENQQIELPISRFFAPEQETDWSDIKMIVFTLKGDLETAMAFSLEVENIQFVQKENIPSTYLADGIQSTLFPNPLVDESTVLFRTLSPVDYTFQLLTPAGIILQQTNGKTTTGINEFKVKNQGYRPGMYFYNIQLSTGEIIGGKVIVPEKT